MDIALDFLKEKLKKEDFLRFINLNQGVRIYVSKKTLLKERNNFILDYYLNHYKKIVDSKKISKSKAIKEIKKDLNLDNLSDITLRKIIGSVNGAY